MKKRLGLFALFIFILFSNEALYCLIINAWQPEPVNLKGRKYEMGIVLGGIVAFDKNSKGYFSEGEDRFYQACKLYYAGTIKKILVSGGTIASDLPEESDFIKNEMTSIGVKPADIITETRSKTTYENAIFTKKIIDSLHIQPPIVLITSAQHLHRATKLFSKAGVSVIPYPSAYTVIKNQRLSLFDYIIPKIKILDAWQSFMKEVAGFAFYYIFNKA